MILVAHQLLYLDILTIKYGDRTGCGLPNTIFGAARWGRGENNCGVKANKLIS